jgi:transcriptional regulator with XRE-family HTH domain
MPEGTQRSTGPEAREAEEAIRRFCQRAVDVAGGKAQLIEELIAIGFPGRSEGGWNERTIEAWLNGRRRPHAVTLIGMALRFRIPLDEVLTEAESDDESLRAEVADLRQRLTVLEGRSA